MYKRVNGVAQAVFLWQGDNLLAELDGTATAKRAEYSYYPGLDNLHAVVINNERLYAHADGLGNVIALTDEAQAVRRQYGYDDWGTSGWTSGTLAEPDADRARWKGALWMGPELDLYYMRNRWYEPATGRFLSEDPIGLAGGINPVVFAADDPVDGEDPSGLQGPCKKVSGGVSLAPGKLADIATECQKDPWPFSTPKESGFSSNFGKRGGTWSFLDYANAFLGGQRQRPKPGKDGPIACGGALECTFRISTGEFACTVGPETVVNTTAYAGAKGYINDPGATGLGNRGPLPAGRYVIEPAYPGNYKRKGTFTSALTPVDPSATNGRGGFLIHGGNRDSTASQGCVILPLGPRRTIAGFGGGSLTVRP